MNKSELWLLTRDTTDCNGSDLLINKVDAYGHDRCVPEFISNLVYMGDFKACVNKMRELDTRAVYNG